MSKTPVLERIPVDAVTSELSVDARRELQAMGLDVTVTATAQQREGIDPVSGRPLLPKQPIKAAEILNEADDYLPRPSSFSRGMRVELAGATMLFLSGTASIDENGVTLYPGDFHAQLLRTFHNLTRLLVAEGASWHDIIRTTCYLRDIERDYDTFNELRTLFMTGVGLDPLPASTGIQARLCRSDLLVEIEAIAMIPEDRKS
jgi:enamine deaminase RidA (YjgF/YER057c/UK114 family)